MHIPEETNAYCMYNIQKDQNSWTKVSLSRKKKHKLSVKGVALSSWENAEILLLTPASCQMPNNVYSKNKLQDFHLNKSRHNKWKTSEKEYWTLKILHNIMNPVNDMPLLRFRCIYLIALRRIQLRTRNWSSVMVFFF